MHRKKRQKVPVPVVALVGYTNSGKSTLLNSLTRADVLTENKLFSTLDPITRHLFLPNRQKVLLTDTVGFIRKLPVQLVEAFKATLEEINEADLLIHVVDLSSPIFENQIAEVQRILADLGAGDKPVLYVYNKIDIVPDLGKIFLRHRRLHPFVLISAEKKMNFDELLKKIETLLSSFVEVVRLKIPIEDQKMLAWIHASGRILEKRFFRKSVRVVAELPPKIARQLKERYA